MRAQRNVLKEEKIKPRPFSLFAISLGMFALFVYLLASPALAQTESTFTVNANTDMVDFLPGDGVCETGTGNGMCTLRAAIMEANVRVGADTIILPPGNYQLTIPGAGENLCATGDLEITESLTIQGDPSQSTVIDALGLNDRVLDTQGNIVSISGIRIMNGDVTGEGGGIRSNADLSLADVQLSQNRAGSHGGGIYSTHPITLTNVQLESNEAGSNGGAIALSLGSATIEDSTIISNTATEEGGGIYNGSPLTLVGVTLSENEAQTGGGMINYHNSATIENSTIIHNRARGNGGGIYDHNMLSIYNFTITANTAAAHPFDPGGRGGGVYAGDINVVTHIQNTILADNHHRQMLNWIPDDCFGELDSGDYNLVETLTNCTLEGLTSHNLTGVDPLLGDLADNGGPTHTQALLEGSPAIDAANPAGCLGAGDALLTSDQRGVARPLDGNADGTARCDMGAFELSLYSYTYLLLTIK